MVCILIMFWTLYCVHWHWVSWKASINEIYNSHYCCCIITLLSLSFLHSLSAIQTPRPYPNPSIPSTRGPKCHPNIDMFWVISSDGISWEELACAKGKVHSSKSSVFPICHHMLQISHVFTKVRHWALSPREEGAEGLPGLVREWQKEVWLGWLVNLTAICCYHHNTRTFRSSLSKLIFRGVYGQSN